MAITDVTPTETPAAPTTGTGTPTAVATPEAPDATQAWRLQIPDDIRGEKSLAQIKDIATLAKGYVEAQKSFGSRIPIPTESDTPQERDRKLNEAWGKLGRPPTPEDYGIGEPQLAEDVPWNMDVQREFLGQAHTLGLSKDQAEGVLEWYVDQVSQASLHSKQESGKVEETLRSEWGRAYDRNKAFAQRAVEAIGGPKLKEYFNASGRGNDIELVKAFSRMGKMLAEAQMISGRVEGVLGPEEAKKKINSIQANPEHPYHIKFKGAPAHEEAVKEMQELFQLAYPHMI